jgi:hypothetical protein
MHEAHPFFNTDARTIADELSETHTTHLISPNLWLSQGINERFDLTTDFSRPYLLYRDASDPAIFDDQYDGSSKIDWLLRYLREDGKPLQSLANLVSHRVRGGNIMPEQSGDEESFQYASQINEQLRQGLAEPGDNFALVNYLDVHPPLDASDEALERFAPDYNRFELPIGTPPERHIVNADKSYDPELMELLYRASIWDLDRKIAPLVAELIENDTFVIVTSDHGLWNCDTAHSKNRLNVPLLLFAPDKKPDRRTEVVNLRSLAATTMDALGRENPFPTGSILFPDPADDDISVTEIIHHPNSVYESTGRVDVTKSPDRDGPIQRNLVTVGDSATAKYINGGWHLTGEADTTAELQSHGEAILEQPIKNVDLDEIQYDRSTQQRLEALGYR